MKELRNLQELAKNTIAEFESYKGEDFVLPQVFKNQVKEINNNKLIYNDYSARIETAGYQNGNLSIYLPNQWFFIASYFTDYYNELQRYKKTSLKVTTKERLKGLNGNALTSDEEAKLNSLEISETSKEYLVSFMTDYSWWGGAKTIDRGDFYVSPILALARLVNASQSFVADLCAFLADKQDLVSAIIQGGKGTVVANSAFTLSGLPLQQIYYGAPGTGKSHIIKELTKGKSKVRTTFHPDSDYSTFVGAYKPTTKSEPKYTAYGEKAMIIKDADGNPIYEDKIVYEFVNQAFLKAYVAAWKQWTNGEAEPEGEYLIIEEINRGNCAQIFGDLFQLLDRNDSGFSDYPIKADNDMKKQLAKAFNGLTIAQAEKINDLYDEDDIIKQVLEGDVLLLPKNLFIWATMNTSDQSLFPIDSAFKRRWDWKYMPINDAGKGWVVEANGNKYSWWDFLSAINELVDSTTSSEDKKLGYFFCKAKDGIIDADTFVGKVVFYLWNDVFKDYGFEGSVFQMEDGSEMSFGKFYKPGNSSVVEEATVERFFINLGLEVVEESQQPTEEEPNHEGDNTEENTSEIEGLRYAFWEDFLTYAHQNEAFEQYFSGIKKASRDAWKDFGVKGFSFWLCIVQQRQRNALEFQVYTNESDAYHKLYNHKDDIERELDIAYDWKELPEKKASKICELIPNVDYSNRDKQKEYFDLCIDRLVRMREVFTKYATI